MCVYVVTYVRVKGHLNVDNVKRQGSRLLNSYEPSQELPLQSKVLVYYTDTLCCLSCGS